MAAAQTLAVQSVEARGVDEATLKPLDEDTLLESVAASGRCVIVQEAPRSFGVASQLVARINDGALLSLEAPVASIAASFRAQATTATLRFFFLASRRKKWPSGPGCLSRCWAQP